MKLLGKISLGCFSYDEKHPSRKALSSLFSAAHMPRTVLRLHASGQLRLPDLRLLLSRPAFIGHLRRLPVWQSGLHHLHERELPQRHPILYAHAKPAARHPGAGYGTERANIAPHTAQRSADATTANGRARQRKMPVIQFAEQ